MPGTIVCCRTSVVLTTAKPPGTKKDKCGKCGAEVWVSPSAQRGLADGSLNEIQCRECYPLAFMLPVFDAAEAEACKNMHKTN